MKYFATAGNRTWEIEVERERVVVDGAPIDARITAIPGTPLHHLVLAGGSWTLAMEPGPGGASWIVSTAGERFPVAVSDQRSASGDQLTGDGRPGAAPGGQVEGAGRGGNALVSAPMPGLVVRIDVAVGQQVNAGAGLVVVEAMKMQNELRAPRAGTVAEVHVRAGQTVERGAPLVTLKDTEPAR